MQKVEKMGKTELSYININQWDLTDKQRQFVVEYCKHYNATQAAKDAGYSARSASEMGRRLLDRNKYPKVAKAIGYIQQQSIKSAIITKEQILQELSIISLRDIIELCDENGQIVVDDLRKLSPAIRRQIEGITIEERDTVRGPVKTYKLTLCRKMQALEMCMKHFGMYEQAETKVTVGFDLESMAERAHALQEEKDRVIEGKIKTGGQLQVEPPKGESD